MLIFIVRVFITVWKYLMTYSRQSLLVSCSAGWIAHILEQYKDNRIMPS